LLSGKIQGKFWPESLGAAAAAVSDPDGRQDFDVQWFFIAKDRGLW
jgi:hypothetical protein